MTQEDKDLLLKDLCARLPYGVKVKVPECISINALKVYVIKQVYKSTFYAKRDEWICRFWNDTFAGLDKVKPYLRPMSSMTKEEKEELVDFGLAYWDNGKYTDEDGNTIIYGGKEIQLIPDIETYDWLNEKMFDYRGLIEKGLAIEVTEENNPYKE